MNPGLYSSGKAKTASAEPSHGLGSTARPLYLHSLVVKLLPLLAHMKDQGVAEKEVLVAEASGNAPEIEQIPVLA